MRRVMIPFSLILTLICYVVSCGTLVTPSPEIPYKVRVGYLKTVGSLPYYVATESDLFERYGLSAEGFEFQSSNMLIEAVVREDIDVGVIFATLVSFAAWQGAADSYRIFQVANVTRSRYTEAILVRPGSGIHDISDLEGMTIGAFPGVFIRKTVQQLAGQHGFVVADSDYMEIAPPAQLAALERGKVDALYALEPIVTLATMQGIGEPLLNCPPCELLEPMPIAVSVVSSKLADNHPDVTRRVVQVFNDSIQLSAQDEMGARQTLIEALGLSKTVAKEVHLAEHHMVDEAQVTQLQLYADLLLEWGLIQEPINVRDMILEQ